MNISKISRSLIVAIFVVFIFFLGIMDVVYIRQNPSLSTISGVLKLGYVGVLILLVFLYTYVREKLARKKMTKGISTLYRYMYITLVMLATTFFKVYNVMDLYPTRTLLLYFALTYAIGIAVQRILFNISKSDVLSILGMFVTFTLPNIIDDKTINLNSKFIAFTMLLAIYVMQMLIDELKQLNIKNKKYIKEALLLGVCVGFGTLFGVNYLLWIVAAVASLFITSNLDSTNLRFSKNGKNKKPTNTIKRKKNNYFIYKIERIKISKLLISLLIVYVVATGIYFGGRQITHSLAANSNGVCGNIVNDLTVGIHSHADLSLSNIKDQTFSFVGLSTRFYILSFVYIVFMEGLAASLHRKYDTKSTLIKLLFMVLFIVLTLFKMDMLYYQPILTLLLVIICIADTTNIYYNREERIKMIEA